MEEEKDKKTNSEIDGINLFYNINKDNYKILKFLLIFNYFFYFLSFEKN